MKKKILSFGKGTSNIIDIIANASIAFGAIGVLTFGIDYMRYRFDGCSNVILFILLLVYFICNYCLRIKKKEQKKLDDELKRLKELNLFFDDNVKQNDNQ